MSAAAAGGAPPSLKQVNKFLLQAKKLDKVDPFVAYHCRMYAMQSGIAVKNKDKAAMDYLKELMMQLEQAKTAIPKLTKDDARQRLETFALNVFKHADDEDRAGKATKKTAASFLAASIFMEVCKQFGELASDIQEKLKYAQWKAADISRAIREGVTPVPGGIENMDDLKLDENGNPIESASPPPQQFSGPPPQPYSGFPPQFPSAPQPHAASAPPHQQFPPAGYPAPQPTHGLPDLPSSLGLPPSVSPRASPVPYQLPSVPFTGPPAASFHPPGPAPIASGPGQLTISANRGLEKLQAILEAEKLSKHAVSALRFQDIQTAIAKFSEAIAVLLPHK